MGIGLQSSKMCRTISGEELKFRNGLARFLGLGRSAVPVNQHVTKLVGKCCILWPNWPEDYDIDLAEGDVVTIAGLVLANRGIVPEQGESIDLPGYRLTVEQTEDQKITHVKLEPVK